VVGAATNKRKRPCDGDSEPASSSSSSSSSLLSSSPSNIPCTSGAIIWKGAKAALCVQDGTPVELGGRLWQTRCTVEALWLTHITMTNDRETQRIRLVTDTEHELHKRKEEMGALAIEQRRLLDFCEDDDLEGSAVLAQIECVSAARGNHKRRIRELDHLTSGEGDVTTVEHISELCLPKDTIVELAGLSAEVVESESLLWFPGSDSARVSLANVEEKERVETARETLHFRVGVFVRQLGSQGDGDGQFNHPIGVAVSKGEVFVCDTNNHRVQVFSVDGTFARKWCSPGNGDDRDIRPWGVAVSGGEVFVCDGSNHCVQIFH
jgi:hypothetical protein